jgi:hypothetical protein
MKKQEFKFILGNGSESEVTAESLSSALGNMSLGEKLKLHKRIVEERSRNKKFTNTSEPEPTPDVVDTLEPVKDEQGPTSEQIARFENLLMRGKEIKAKIKELEEEIQKDLEKDELVRIIRFQLENPREPSTVEIENLLKENSEFTEIVKQIEKDRKAELAKEEIRYEGEVGELRGTSEWTPTKSNELLQRNIHNESEINSEFDRKIEEVKNS